VMPESALLVRSHAIAPLQSLADRHDLRIVIGAEDHADPARKRNAALVFDPGAPMPATYHKRHLIPGLEDRYTPGDTRTMLGGSPATGVSICKDLDFTATARDHAVRGTQLLLVPAWDFDVGAWLHGRMAAMRGGGGGFAIARGARVGDRPRSDHRGRALADVSAAHAVPALGRRLRRRLPVAGGPACGRRAAGSPARALTLRHQDASKRSRWRPPRGIADHPIAGGGPPRSDPLSGSRDRACAARRAGRPSRCARCLRACTRVRRR